MPTPTLERVLKERVAALVGDDLIEVEREIRRELDAPVSLIQEMGAYIAERLAFLTRMATVVPQAARSGNSERAAQKSGLKLRTFTDMDEAKAWLRG